MTTVRGGLGAGGGGGGEGEVTHLEFWGEGRGYIRKGNYMACIINSLNEGG